MASDFSSLPIYGATRTTTFTTTILVTSNQQSATIYYPDPPITEPLSYTTLPYLSGVETLVADSTTVLPILVLTDVVGVVASSSTPIATETLIQPPPAQGTFAKIGIGNSTTVSTGCLAWNCWTQPQKIGTGFGIALAALAVLTFSWWAWLWRKRNRARKMFILKRGKRQSSMGRDVEEGHGGGILLATAPQRRWPWRQRTRSTSIERDRESSTSDEATRRTRDRNRKLRDGPSVRVHREYPDTVPRISVPPQGYQPNLNRFPNISTAAVVGDSEAARRRASSTPPRRLSMNRPSPRGPAQAAAQVQFANISTRRAHFREDPAQMIPRPPISVVREQLPQRNYSARESQSRSYERRSRARGRDEDSETDLGGEPPYRKHSARERENIPPISSTPHHRRSRSASYHTDRHQRALSKWMALLPLALGVLYELAEPDGGWNKYLPKNFKNTHNSSHDHTPRAPPRSFRPSPSRSRSTDSAYNRYQPPRVFVVGNKEDEMRGRSIAAERGSGATRVEREFSFSPSPPPWRRSTRRVVRTTDI